MNCSYDLFTTKITTGEKSLYARLSSIFLSWAHGEIDCSCVVVQSSLRNVFGAGTTGSVDVEVELVRRRTSDWRELRVHESGVTGDAGLNLLSSG